MRIRSGLRLLVSLSVLTLLAASKPSAPGAQRERPDDPPGVPARPPVGGRRTEVMFGPYTHVQVNVLPGGINIPSDAANEPSIAVDPTQPNNIAIGWREFTTILSNFRQAGVGHSSDGGRTWTETVLDSGVFRSDPVLGFDAEGNFYYNSLKVVTNVFDCWVFKSSDGGASWGAPVYSFGGDKQWMAIDRTGGIGHGHVYQWWSIAAGCCGNDIFTRSIDGAASFQTPTTIPGLPLWGSMDVAPSGTLFLAGVDANDMSTFYVSKSTNVRNPGATPSFTTTVVDLDGSVVGFAGINSPNPSGLLGQVQLAVNPLNGHIYLLSSVSPGAIDPMEVHFSRSEDGGATWTTATRVNDDLTISWQWFATMSVAPNGRIDVVWNDTRNTGVANESELFYSFSTDGGDVWSVNQQLSPAFDSHLGWPNQQKMGDYYDMISDDVGAHLAWAATFNLEQDVYYVRLGDYDCNTNGVGDSLDIASGTSYDQNANGIPDECEPGVTAVRNLPPTSYVLHQNQPNPFNPATTIRFVVPPGGGSVRIKVIDVSGRHIRTLVNMRATGGEKSVTWDGRDDGGRLVASGVYFYRLDSPTFNATRKMLLLK